MNSSRSIQFEPDAFDEFIGWATEDKKVFFKIAELIEEVRREPLLVKANPNPSKQILKVIGLVESRMSIEWFIKF